MIISVSRRTDIPAFYSEWFFNRLKEGFVLSVNPFNRKMLTKLSLKQEDVTCFVFWTKNPSNFIKRLDELDGYSFYFQFTLNSYQKDLEPNVPLKKGLIKNFIELSEKIGKERVIWRYDPILINEKYTKEYHYKWFEELCKKLHDYTNKVVISFIDFYNKTKRNTKELNIQKIEPSEIEEVAAKLSEIARKYYLRIETCSESIDLEKYNICHGKCIDDVLIGKIIGDEKFSAEKDRFQRKECGCVNSSDIGAYNTCLHNCLYCYANFNKKTIRENNLLHDPESPLLIGKVEPDMKIYDRNEKEKLKKKPEQTKLDLK